MANITCHQRSKDGSMIEIVATSGGPWGGRTIDDAFCSFLKKICGSKAIEDLRDKDFQDYIDLFRDFETRKRSIKVDQTNKVVVRLPTALLELVRKHRGKMETALEQSPYSHSVSCRQQKLCISPDTFRDLFKPTIDALIKHLNKMFKDIQLRDLTTVIMAGGFSGCELIQHRIKQEFGKDRNIIIPDEPGIVVLKGAVICGHLPGEIVQRISRLTYGIRCWNRWDSQLHPESKKLKFGEDYLCEDFFLKFVRVGQTIEPGSKESFELKVLNIEDGILRIAIFVSPDYDPRYVTDAGCQRLGDIIIPVEAVEQSSEVEVTMTFGNTELLVRVRHCASGRVVENSFILLGEDLKTN